jgi:hypothetical protein
MMVEEEQSKWRWLFCTGNGAGVQEPTVKSSVDLSADQIIFSEE